jgi:hypothetical protein
MLFIGNNQAMEMIIIDSPYSGGGRKYDLSKINETMILNMIQDEIRSKNRVYKTNNEVIISYFRNILKEPVEKELSNSHQCKKWAMIEFVDKTKTQYFAMGECGFIEYYEFENGKTDGLTMMSNSGAPVIVKDEDRKTIIKLVNEAISLSNKTNN